MTTPIDKALGEGNCVRATVGGKEAIAMDEWQNRITFNNLQFAERYLKRELHVLVEFRIRGVYEQFVAYLERTAPVVIGAEKYRASFRQR